MLALCPAVAEDRPLRKLTLVALVAVLLTSTPFALERKDVTFKIFQFPADQIPRVDGKTDDWAVVPESYAVGMDELMDTEQGHGMNHDTKNLDVKVKVGWVKGLNRLYFLYEGFDNYWDFAASGLHNDIFEVVVDGDLSGGPLIDIYHRDVWTPEAVGPRSELDPRVTATRTRTSATTASTRRTTTSSRRQATRTGRWRGAARSTTKDLPYANAAYGYNFKPGEAGKLVLEFWITPFDYAPLRRAAARGRIAAVTRTS